MPKFIFISLIIILLFIPARTVHGDCEKTCRFYQELANDALQIKNYKKAIYYFEMAFAVNPLNEDLLNKIDNIKRLLEINIKNTEIFPLNKNPKVLISEKKVREEIQENNLVFFEKIRQLEIDVIKIKQQQILSTKNYETMKPQIDQEPIISLVLDKTEKSILNAQSDKKIIQSLENLVKTENLNSQEFKQNPVVEIKYDYMNTIELNDESLRFQPNMPINVELKKYVIIRGVNIKSFLIVSPEIFGIERVDRSSIKIYPKSRGSTFLHVWDETGRWTFYLSGITPAEIKIDERQIAQYENIKFSPPFRMGYANNWSSFYLGENMRNLERDFINYKQWFGIWGQSPYGFLDASFNTEIYDETVDVVEKTIGLTDGNIGYLENFALRVFDASAVFSPLSLPGRYFRGVSLDAFALNHNIRYKIIHGQDKSTFRFLTPGAADLRESYIEGASIIFFPQSKNQFLLNFARGYGPLRPVILKDKVYSIGTNNWFNNYQAYSEIAFDEEAFGKIAGIKTEEENYALNINFWDIEKDFSTITGSPSGQGEIGGNIFLDLYSDYKNRLSSNIEVYRDREFFNIENKNKVNFDFNTFFVSPLSEALLLNCGIYYSDTPQLISPRKSFRFSSTLSNNLKIFNNRNISAFVGQSFQTNRYEINPASDFDKYGIITGFRVPIIDNLSCFVNYEYTWTKDVLNNKLNNPSVLNTGLSYYKKLIDSISSRYSIVYRDEEDTSENFSFLAGEDSLSAQIGFTYRPINDFEIFLDASMRNIWTENPENEAYNEADLRFGLRASFDTAFSWDPSCIITGIVYKDLDGNFVYSNNEPGVPEVKINIGNKNTMTNKSGKYRVKVRAKEIKVAIDMDSVPSGFIFVNKTSYIIPVQQNKTEIVNFGLTARSGVHGIVFYDKNANNQLDDMDEPIANVKILLQGIEEAMTNYNGEYLFDNINYGKHVIIIDLSTIPIEYVPAVKLRNEINLEEGKIYNFNVPLIIK